MFTTNKTVYTILDGKELRATSIAWKLPYFELKKYITKLRLPSQNGMKMQVLTTCLLVLYGGDFQISQTMKCPQIPLFYNFTFSLHFHHIFITFSYICAKYLYNLVFAKYHFSITKLTRHILYHCHKNVIVMWLDLKIFFWSSHVTITFLWQLYKNVMRHNFLMEMWLPANIGYDSQY